MSWDKNPANFVKQIQEFVDSGLGVWSDEQKGEISSELKWKRRCL